MTNNFPQRRLAEINEPRIFIMLRSMIIVLAMLLFALPAFSAPARLDTLAISRSEAGVELGCAQDQLCMEITPSQANCEGQACDSDAELRLKLPGSLRELASTPYRLSDLASADKNSSLRMWPKLIRFEGGVLAGVETHANTSYSGGGASSTTLHLIAFLRGQPPFEILSVPQSAHAMIRACFSERDMKFRAGACHDEYTFQASLVPTGKSAAEMPVLRYRSKATSFPGHVSRSKDSLTGKPLRQRDVVTVTDPRCSYQRLYHFSLEARSYVTDREPPDCSDYTVP